MGWKCDFCDSYNEDGTVECYVCKSPRSAESIKIEKEEKLAAFNILISKRIIAVLQVLFILGLSAFLVTLIVTLILKTTGSRLDDIWQLTKTTVIYLYQNIIKMFGGDSWHKKFSHFSYARAVDLYANAKAVWAKAGNKVSFFTGTAFSDLLNIAEGHIRIFYSFFQNGSYGITSIGRRVSMHIANLGITGNMLINTALASILRLPGLITYLYAIIISHFN